MMSHFSLQRHRYLFFFLTFLVGGLGLAQLSVQAADQQPLSRTSTQKAVAGSVLIDHNQVVTSPPSGPAITIKQHLTVFKRIHIHNFPGDITFIHGASSEAILKAEKKISRKIRITTSRGTLNIKAINSFSTSAPLAITIMAPDWPREIIFSGSGTFTMHGFQGQCLRLQTTGAGTLQVSGQTNRLEVEADGSGDLQLAELHSRQCRIVMQGASSARISVSNRLEATLNGASSLIYAGKPSHISAQVNDAADMQPTVP